MEVKEKEKKITEVLFFFGNQIGSSTTGNHIDFIGVEINGNA
jgi:hypothetical protein